MCLQPELCRTAGKGLGTWPILGVEASALTPGRVELAPVARNSKEQRMVAALELAPVVGAGSTPIASA